jgi:tRNA A-37 threonylcarbamoyl transferase component Bud32
MTHITLLIRMLNGKNITVHDVTKRRLTKDLWSNEVECYRRLASCDNVPNLINANEKDLTITTSYAGTSLFILTAVQKRQGKKLVIDNPIQQVTTFIDACKEQNIVHLDCHPGNILLQAGKLSFIDFEKVAIDETTLTTKLEKKYSKFKMRGGWSWILNRYTKYFETFDNSIWYRDDILEKGIRRYGQALQ